MTNFDILFPTGLLFTWLVIVVLRRRASQPMKAHEAEVGSWHGMPVRLRYETDGIECQVELPHAVTPYRELISRFASPELLERMRVLDLHVDPQDKMLGRAPRAAGHADNHLAVARIIAVAHEVRALRKHVPSEIVRAIGLAQSTHEVDELIVSLATHFPGAPLSDAIAQAAQRVRAQHAAPSDAERPGLHLAPRFVSVSDSDFTQVAARRRLPHS